ncbi:MAG TPA: hypothetical protein VFV50_10775, partial [Bdellovibrionales bacterium]|nr:hypothetical protein [Bdellovibrionales bacterium]
TEVFNSASGIRIDAIAFTTNWLYIAYTTGDIYRLHPATFAGGLINDTSVGTSIVNKNNLRLFVKSGATNATDLVLVGTSGNSTVAATRYGLFKSTDSGASFTQIMNGMSGNFIFSIAVDPSDANRMLVGSGNGRGVYRSTDGGASWTAASNNIYSNASTGLTQNPSQASHLLISSSAGGGFGTNFESFDGGATWARFDDPTTDDGVFSFDIDPSNASNILAGTMTKGVWRSTNGSSGPWTQIFVPAAAAVAPIKYIYRLIRDKVTSSKVYAVVPTGAAGNSLFYSSDSGQSFTARAGVVAWAIAPHPYMGGAAVGVNGADAFVTTDSFATTSSLGLAGYAAAEGGFSSVAVNPTNSAEVIVGGSSGGFYKTTNFDTSAAGITWTKMTSPATAIQLVDVAIANRGGRSVYYAVTFGGQTSFAANSTVGFFRSLDGGSTWTSITTGAWPCTIGWRLLADVASPSTTFYAGLWSGGLLKLVDYD